MHLGNFQIDIVSDGSLWLDGGAMFGVVPRVMWEKVCPPDDSNRVRLGLNCVLARTGEKNILIDTGVGTKWTEKQRAIYNITHETTIIDSLARLGLAPEDIDIVVNSHLHFDHCGANTTIRDGRIEPTFPNARYLVQRGEYEHACSPNERDRASYLKENWEPLLEAGQLEFIDGDCEIAPGVFLEVVPGHNKNMMCARIESGGETVFCFFDLVPMTHHLALPWIMAYDLTPVETLEQKKRLIPQAIRERWLCIFYHDHRMPVARVIEEDGKVKAVSITNLRRAPE